MQGHCQSSHPEFWSILLLLSVVTLSVALVTTSHRPSMGGPYWSDEQYNYGFLLTENASDYVIDVDVSGAVEVTLSSLETNGAPVTLIVREEATVLNRFTDLAVARQGSLVFVPAAYDFELVFSRQLVDASVEVTLVVTRQVYLLVDVATFLLFPFQIVPLFLSLFALWRLNAIERECRIRLAPQARWKPRRGLRLVALFAILTALMTAPFISMYLVGGYNVIPKSVFTYHSEEIHVDSINPVGTLNLTAIGEDSVLEDMTVSAVASDGKVSISLFQSGYLLLELKRVWALNQSYIHVQEESSFTELEVRRTDRNATVLVTVGVESIVYEIGNNPIPFIVLMMAGAIPLVHGARLLRHIQSRLEVGPYVEVEIHENQSSYGGPLVE